MPKVIMTHVDIWQNDRVKVRISIAHTVFREEIKEKAITMGIVFEEEFN